MIIKERIRIYDDEVTIQNLLHYEAIFNKEVDLILNQNIENAAIQNYPYYAMQAGLAPASKPLLVQYAFLLKQGKLEKGPISSIWHMDSLRFIEHKLQLLPGHGFPVKLINCKLHISKAQRVLLYTHNVLQVDILHQKDRWYACFHIENKPLAYIKKGIREYTISSGSSFSIAEYHIGKQNEED